MLEMKQTGPDQAALWEDKAPAGGAAWTWATLCWGRERARVIRLRRFEAAEHNKEALLAYLEYLWEGQGVAALEWPDGTLQWYHKALEKSWQAAGSPRAFAEGTQAAPGR